jgi:transcriptional regulator with XRE-family HTH domain
MPTRLAAARKSRGWTQQRLLTALRRQAAQEGIDVPPDAVLRVTLSGWENGRHEPGDLYRRLLAAALDLPEVDLGFDPPPASTSAPPPPPAGPQLVAYLETALLQHVQADRLIGSARLAPVVQEQLKVIEACLQASAGSVRDDLLRLANRYAEFCGWLHQDQGRFADAQRWTTMALDFAHALGEPELLSYTLMRRSGIANDAGQPQEALLLADAALRPQDLPPRLTALALRVKAAAHAGLRDERSFRHTVEQGIEAASANDSSPVTAYCTDSYIRMEAGAAALTLDSPVLALELLSAAHASWPQGEDRDHALCLARLAQAHAAARDPDQACVLGHEAIEALQATSSGRAAATVRAIRATLNNYRANPNVKEFRQHVAEVLP